MAQTQADIALRALQEWWVDAGLDPTEVRASAAQRGVNAPLAKQPKPAPPSPLELAQRAAGSAQTLEALRHNLSTYTGCTLRTAARSTVFLAGPERAPILLIGQSPDKTDDASGQPFSGPAGALLDAMLTAIGLSRADHVMLSYLVFWRPPGDRVPTPAEIALCLPFMERAIALLAPKVLVLCGALAAQTLLRSEAGLTQLRRKIHSYPAPKGPAIDALVMHNPVYLLGRPQEKALAWQDLQILEARLEELAVARGRSI